MAMAGVGGSVPAIRLSRSSIGGDAAAATKGNNKILMAMDDE
jgi:hypothetical protein